VSVRIERLSIRDFGPLRDLVLSPGDVTVVYGRNEAGKTSCIDALVRALRDRVRSGNRKLLDQLREGPGFEGQIELQLSPEDGGPLLALLREHPSLARLFIVRDGDAALEGGRNWLNSIRDRLIGIDLGRVGERVRSAASLTPGGALREARQDERQRLEERLTLVNGFLSDLPSLGRLLEEIHQIERQRVAARTRLEKLRAAERFERYRVAKRASLAVEAAERDLRLLERYGDTDLTEWRDGVSTLREAAALAKSSEEELHRLGEGLASAIEELRKRDLAVEKASATSAEVQRRSLSSLLERARAQRAAAKNWSLWRIPLIVAALLLLALATGAGVEALTRVATPQGLSMAIAAGAAGLGGILCGALAMLATSRIRTARTSEAEMLAASGVVLTRAETLEDCEAHLAAVTSQFERALIERTAGAEQRRSLEASIDSAKRLESERQRTLEDAQRRIADVRGRVGLASLNQLEEKLRSRAAARSTVEEALRTLRSLLGDIDSRVPLDRRVEALAVPDPGVAPDGNALSDLEREIEGFDERLVVLRGEVAERRDRTLTRLGLKDLGAVEAERDRLAEAVATIDREAAGATLCLQALRELAQDIDRPLREALGSGPAAAGFYLSRLTSGAYRSVVLDSDGRLAVEREDGTRFGSNALSRGARDQLSLAVRLSLVRRLLGEPAFLVLDDAFLSSDPGRREALAAAVADLANEGWQILYFTFDEALRDRMAALNANVVHLAGRTAVAAAPVG
jgi:recombinational DNA repair ATPase RecF